MTAKEFDTKFWQENNPMTTPLWKYSEAYHQYRLKESKDYSVIHSIIESWECLPEGNHSPEVVAKWLLEDMKPSIDKIRQLVNSL